MFFHNSLSHIVTVACQRLLQTVTFFTVACHRLSNVVKDSCHRLSKVVTVSCQRSSKVVNSCQKVSEMLVTDCQRVSPVTNSCHRLSESVTCLRCLSQSVREVTCHSCLSQIVRECPLSQLLVTDCQRVSPVTVACHRLSGLSFVSSALAPHLSDQHRCEKGFD